MTSQTDARIHAEQAIKRVQKRAASQRWSPKAFRSQLRAAYRAWSMRWAEDRGASRSTFYRATRTVLGTRLRALVDFRQLHLFKEHS